jgi:hypothetical protein
MIYVVVPQTGERSDVAHRAVRLGGELEKSRPGVQNNYDTLRIIRHAVHLTLETVGAGFLGLAVSSVRGLALVHATSMSR